jgi:hypothetical protein
MDRTTETLLRIKEGLRNEDADFERLSLSGVDDLTERMANDALLANIGNLDGGKEMKDIERWRGVPPKGSTNVTRLGEREVLVYRGRGLYEVAPRRAFNGNKISDWGHAAAQAIKENLAHADGTVSSETFLELRARVKLLNKMSDNKLPELRPWEKQNVRDWNEQAASTGRVMGLNAEL